jgi:phosphoribosylaminoimidazole (AIR) synthetase
MEQAVVGGACDLCLEDDRRFYRLLGRERCWNVGGCEPVELDDDAVYGEEGDVEGTEVPCDLVHDPYVAAGVDYTLLDGAKRLALAAALPTSGAMLRLGGEAIDATREESAFAFRLGPYTLALVLEGLGTKSMIARAYREASGVNRFGDVAYDTVAAILNDLCCVGATPLVLNAYFATGSSDWYSDPEQAKALIGGWRRGCDDAECTWGGGESPSLSGLVTAGEIEPAGSAVGLVPSDRLPLSGGSVCPGTELVFVASSGLHANGASLAREVATRLADGYLTPTPEWASVRRCSARAIAPLRQAGPRTPSGPCACDIPESCNRPRIAQGDAPPN